MTRPLVKAAAIVAAAADSPEALEIVLKRADDALYTAKAGGRGRVAQLSAG